MVGDLDDFFRALSDGVHRTDIPLSLPFSPSFLCILHVPFSYAVSHSPFHLSIAQPASHSPLLNPSHPRSFLNRSHALAPSLDLIFIYQFITSHLHSLHLTPTYPTFPTLPPQPQPNDPKLPSHLLISPWIEPT